MTRYRTKADGREFAVWYAHAADDGWSDAQIADPDAVVTAQDLHAAALKVHDDLGDRDHDYSCYIIHDLAADTWHRVTIDCRPRVDTVKALTLAQLRKPAPKTRASQP